MKALILNWRDHLASCFDMAKHFAGVHREDISSSSGSRVMRGRKGFMRPIVAGGVGHLLGDRSNGGWKLSPTICWVFLCLLMVSCSPPEANGHGRYQLVAFKVTESGRAVFENNRLFKIDTRTGRTWEYRNDVIGSKLNWGWMEIPDNAYVGNSIEQPIQ